MMWAQVKLTIRSTYNWNNDRERFHELFVASQYLYILNEERQIPPNHLRKHYKPRIQIKQPITYVLLPVWRCVTLSVRRPAPFSTRQRYFPSSPCLMLVRFNTGPRESTFPGSESLIQVTFACGLLSFMIHCNVIDSSSVVLRSLGYAGSMMGGSG